MYFAVSVASGQPRAAYSFSGVMPNPASSCGRQNTFRGKQPGDRLSGAAPPRATEPESGLTIPRASRNSVDFPAPFSPLIRTIFDASISADAAERIVLSPAAYDTLSNLMRVSSGVSEADPVSLMTGFSRPAAAFATANPGIEENTVFTPPYSPDERATAAIAVSYDALPYSTNSPAAA